VRELWPSSVTVDDPLAVDASLHWDQVRADCAVEARHARREAEQVPRDTAPMPIVVVDAQPQPWPWSPPVAGIGGGR
jgi:hypothetical protein